MIEPSARGAWRDLDAKLRPFVARRVGSVSDVDDVVQDVFLRMQRGLPALREDSRFGSWVYQIARSAIADHHRMKARHPLPPSGEEGEGEGKGEGLLAAPPPPALAEENDAASELASYVATFIAMLDSPYREALTLTELQGLSQKEAAEMLGISLSGMKSRVQRGRARLREALEACCRIAVDARGHVV
jgi:RNA polymerase sigma-70 factor, ECF subfamily